MMPPPSPRPPHLLLVMEPSPSPRPACNEGCPPPAPVMLLLLVGCSTCTSRRLTSECTSGLPEALWLWTGGDAAAAAAATDKE